jgi:hypothetical protein
LGSSMRWPEEEIVWRVGRSWDWNGECKREEGGMRAKRDAYRLVSGMGMVH